MAGNMDMPEQALPQDDLAIGGAINPAGVPFLQAENLRQAGISHAFFTRQGGVSGGIYASLNGGLGSDDTLEHVHENRARMAHALGVAPANLLSLYQVHSAEVITVRAPWPVGERPSADAMVTQLAGVALGIGTADCGPILFADAKARVIGAAHAGWKGAFSGIVENTLAAMEALGAQRSDIRVALGPMLSQAHYAVGADYQTRFIAQDAQNARFFGYPNGPQGQPHFDLPRYIRARLIRAGIAQIEDLALCTYADEARFYSYRRKTHRDERDYGRQICAIRL